MIWRVKRPLCTTGGQNCGTGMTNYLLVVFHLFNHLALGRMESFVSLEPWSLATNGASRLITEIVTRNFIYTSSNIDGQFSIGKIDWNGMRCADAAAMVQLWPPTTNLIPWELFKKTCKFDIHFTLLMIYNTTKCETRAIKKRPKHLALDKIIAWTCRSSKEMVSHLRT